MVWPEPFDVDTFEAQNKEVFDYLYRNCTSKSHNRKAAYVLLFLWPGSPVHHLCGPERSLEAAFMVGLFGDVKPDKIQHERGGKGGLNDADLSILTFEDDQVQCYHEAYNELRVNAAAQSLDYAASFEAALFYRAMMEINSPGTKKDAWLESAQGPKYADFFRESAQQWAKHYQEVFRVKDAEEERNQEEIGKIRPSVHEQSMAGQASGNDGDTSKKPKKSL